MPIVGKVRIVEDLLVLKVHAMIRFGEVNGGVTRQGLNMGPHGVTGFVLVGEQEDVSALGAYLPEVVEAKLLSDNGRFLIRAQCYKI